jgi:ABC-type lipoprotein export system ATPase subunit
LLEVDRVADASAAVVRARGLSRTYGSGDAEVRALRDASFEIRSGDRIALVGPSGSGKTTLLHLTAALDRPTEGTIEWPALGLAEGLRPGRIGLVFQGPSMLPPLDVEENVAVPLLLLNRPEGEAKAAAGQMLERFGLLDVRTKLPEELSGGQSQRAALARALATGPRLLLADEPTGQQDQATAERVMQVLLDEALEGDIALLVATHDARVAERMDRQWRISDGVLETEVRASSR